MFYQKLQATNGAIALKLAQMMSKYIRLKVNVLYRKLKGGDIDGFVFCKKFSSDRI